ncbi:MAG: hypothetical protein NTX45_10930 [Proteobacteria bacterium]|nr:hypothetical protein [Pseudomonadota bacterium]
MKTQNFIISLFLIASLGFIGSFAWGEPLVDASIDPQAPSSFSHWLWASVFISSGLAFAMFLYMHKNFMPYDYLMPQLLSLLITYALVVGPVYWNKNIYGWFGEDCFLDAVVTENREEAVWAEPKQSRPAECVYARENIEALGIKLIIKNYQKGFLDYRPLTTNEIMFIYAAMLILWTLFLDILWLYLYKKIVIK